jgi:formylmethanofuran dehydrogenase subunit E
MEEAFQENLAQAHRDNYEEQCGECGNWIDEDDLVSFQGGHICPVCLGEYVLTDSENEEGGLYGKSNSKLD